ncbi:MAG TPA: VWA domain-containing protein, partial [Puia sp.]|nr:VWA domain-containing protein [Puia sp.]
MLYDWYQHIYFSQPSFFGLLAILPLLIYWELQKSDEAQATVLVSSVRQFGNARSWRNMLRPLPFVFRLLAIGCIILALARPQTRNDEQLVTGEGIDIVLCLDISGSMLAQDFTPNRMEAAKNVAG